MNTWRGKESNSDKLRAWFAENPGEFVTYEDLALKFDMHMEQVYRIVGRLRQEKLVQVQTLITLNPDRPREPHGA